MNVAITLKDQRPRHIRRVFGTAARHHGLAFIPWPICPLAEAADRPSSAVSRCEQRRPVRSVGTDGGTRLEVSGHARQGAARTAGSWIDRTHTDRRATRERRQSHLFTVRADMACHRRLRRQMHTDQNPFWPVARKITDTAGVSVQHAGRVNRRGNSRFPSLIDTPSVSIRPVFRHRMTRLPCSFLDIPSAAGFPARCFRWGEQALAVRRRAGDLTFLNVERPPRAAAEVSP